MSTLKKTLGEAGAWFSDDHGEDNLHAVLSDLAEAKRELVMGAYQATIATAQLNGFIAEEALTLTKLRATAGTTGTVGQTDVDVMVDDVSVATAVIDNTDADDLVLAATIAAAGIIVPIDSVVKLEVTVAPTGGADLVVSAVFERALAVTVES